jgi:cell division protein FtsI (penicillin-binding protein 3)
VKLVNENFEDDPGDFIDFMYSRKFNEKTGVSIKGESAPTIPKPSDDNWSGVTLPWVAYGYSIAFTPLQLLTMYNAVANDGVMVQPQVVDRIMDHGRTVEQFETKVLNPAICSKETNDKLKTLLEGVVENGTATNLKNGKMKLAGKTGTCQLNYWVEGSQDYQSSFAGYFPAAHPKYSCVVVVSKPVKQLGYYGNIVAGPVFKAIADEVYSQMPQEAKVVNAKLLAINEVPTGSIPRIDQAFQKNYVPSFKGLDAREVLQAVGPHNIKVSMKGTGHVMSQSPAVGTPLNTVTEIKLTLR